MTVIYIFFLALCSVAEIDGRGQFPYSKCRQRVDGVHCEEIHVNRGKRDRVSQWPPGLFALPMSKFGCPESGSHGWERGYLKLSWKEPHSMFSTNAIFSDKDILLQNFSQFQDIISDVWLNTQSMVNGPYGKYFWKMNFCMKVRQNETLDVGQWVSGNYRIYSGDSTCPEGFDKKQKTFNLPENTTFTSSGKVPEFEVEEDQQSVKLKISMCEKREDHSGQNVELRVTDTVFVLIKNEESVCPELEGTIALADSLIAFQNDNGSIIVDMMQSFCHYRPETTVQQQEQMEKSTKLASEFHTSTGQIATSLKYTWIQLDFGQTLPLSMIEIRQIVPDERSFVRCFCDDTKWSFAYLEAKECLITTYLEDSSFTLILRNAQGRYVTIVFKADSGLPVNMEELFKVFIYPLETAGVESCNTDLGMTDSSIQDFQIRASSAHQEYLPSAARPGHAGWCAKETDENPWIMVDLITKTRLEGISLWNWEETSANRWAHSVEEIDHGAFSNFNRGKLAFDLYYGTTEEKMNQYNNTNLCLDGSLPVNEEQSFVFSTAVETRFVKLQLKSSSYSTNRCLRFELRGCKLSGVQSLKCEDAFTMFKISTEVRGTEKQAQNASSMEHCEEFCSQHFNCSTAQFEGIGKCFLYGTGSLDIWQTSLSMSGQWSAKVCSKDSLEVLPIQVYNDNYVAFNLQYIVTETVIASVEYPFTSGSGQVYKWLIHFPEEVFVGITFTNVSMGSEDPEPGACYNRLYIDTDIMHNKHGKRIDFHFNGRIFYVETSKSLLFLTFLTCHEERANVQAPVGFRAIVTKESTPACMAINSKMALIEGRQEMCDKPEMFLTSMSLLNFPFLNTTERWEIYAIKHNRIQLQILEFYVRCPETVDSELHSIFTVVDFHEENTYCNTKRPPDILYSYTGKITVTFYKAKATRYLLRIEGFRFLYRNQKQTFEHMTDYQEVSLSLSNVALGKPGTSFIIGDPSFTYTTWTNAFSATDGDRFPLLIGSCIFTSDFFYFHPWWVVDLNGIFSIYSVILYPAFYATFFQPYFIIMTGMNANNMSWNNNCAPYGKRIKLSLTKTRTRYVKVVAVYTFTLELCEAEIYGIFEEEIETSRHGDLESFLSGPTPPDSAWFQTCSILAQNNLMRNYSEWTSWGECSVVCGTGIKRRTRKCLESSVECLGSTEDSDVCIGSGLCPVCSKQFQKCYSIISELTNWETAGYYCWRQNQTLVNIASKEEMAYVSYLLRDYRYNDNFALDESETDNSNFAHIGLYRHSSVDGKKMDLWEDTSPVIFSAWYPGNPTTENCTKMDFNVFGAEQTWHSENCYRGLTQYFVCQEHVESEIPNTRRTRQKRDFNSYKGTVNRTISGTNCLRWDSPLLENAFVPVNTKFPDNNISDANNYCRDPWESDYVYCFTAAYGRKYEVERCIIPESENSHCNVSGWIEEGHVNITYSGKPCRNWRMKSNDTNLSDEHMDVADTYCHDRTSKGFLWCYIDESEVEWEPCFVTNKDEEARNIAGAKWNISVYQCTDGEEIHMSRKCDGRFDCSDKSDETLCDGSVEYHLLFHNMELNVWELPSLPAANSFYRCDNFEWISVLAYCDGVIDCLDSSDERYCNRQDGECFDNEFSCNDGGCIQISKVCDLITDCIDASDEFCELRQCGTNEYTCENGQCIPVNKRCNTVTDCLDKSDESNCDEASCTAAGTFHCDIAKCIPYRLVCDTYADCEDGTDERSCFSEPVKSCDDIWESGQRLSGKYLLDSFGNTVICDFSTLDKDGYVHFKISDLDVDTTSDETLIYLTSDDILKDREYLRELIALGYTCKQEVTFWGNYFGSKLIQSKRNKVKLTCPFVQRKASVFDDPEHQTVYPFCGCTWYDTKSGKRPCNGSKMMLEPQNMEWTFNFEGNTLTFQIYNQEFYDSMTASERPIEFAFAPVECSYEYIQVEDVIACKGDIKVLPSSEKCVYDTAGSGFRTGCRSGSHLENCNDFKCPNGTVKCPGSYCVPTRFVCDGTVQCPGAEDERDCYCTNSPREVVILIEQSKQGSKLQTIIENLARQFYTNGSIIRILYYSTETPLEAFFVEHRSLEIREERVNPYETIKRMEDCFYKTFASNFLKHVKFSIHALNGIIFIEDGEESSVVANLMFSNVTVQSEMNIYRVKQDNNAEMSKPNVYDSVTDVRIRRWDVLSSFGHKYFPDICAAASNIPCRGGYRCSASKQCLTLHEICDGINHCVDGDDERLCDFFCPPQCNCSGFAVNCKSQDLNETDFPYFSANTRHADLSQNPALKSLLTANILNLPKLLRLNMSMDEIELVKPNAFIAIRNLLLIDLSYNNITSLPENVFIHLGYLEQLNLDGNSQLKTIAASAFHGLKSLRKIKITGTKLKLISSYSFAGLTLDSIDISNNQIEEIEDFAFSTSSVENINIEGNDISTFNKDVFTGLTSLKRLRTPAFKFCCVRPNYVNENNCYPTKDEFSSCEDLMRLPVLQTILWLVGIASLLGNIGSIIYRLVYDRERLKIGFGIFVTNLAVADFLMGVYLIIIAIADSVYRKRYIYMDDYWRNSTWCNIAGILSSVSSEASVLFVCLITIDRLLVIKYPFGQIRLTPKHAVMCSAASWILAFALALIPVLDSSYFENRFYSRSGVCIALPLTRDQPPGWEYSLSIFVGLNFITFILVALGQLLIFLELRKPKITKTKSEASRKRDLQVTRNLILVATTDFLCWFPIGLMGIMALMGYPIPGDVYAWTVVFILPFNSALNPVLYTLTAIFGKRKFTPRSEEQTGVNELKKESGSSILQFLSVSRFVKIRRDKRENRPKELANLRDMMEAEHVSPATIITSAWMLAKYLSVIHERSLVVDELNANTVYLSAGKKRIRYIHLDSQMSLTLDDAKSRDNMYQFGIMLRGLVRTCKLNRDIIE